MSDIERSPKEILEAASPKVRKTVNEILAIEHEYQNYRNPRPVEKEIAQRIKKLVDREFKQ